jgi:zinc protease
MLEHMLFKPTTGKGVKWKDLENKGAYLNATTWLDRTLYYFNLPKEYLGDMLAVEADRMRNTLLTHKEFEPERANVLSEYEMYNSRPEMALDWHMVATAFQTHTYHHDTIGFRTDIEHYTTASLKSFYDRYYWPNNATLIIAGDVDESLILALVEQHFASLSRGDIETYTPFSEPVQEGTRRVTLMRDTPLRLLNMAFKAPPFLSPDWTALMVGIMYLTSGETSPLYTKLVGQNLATSVEGHLYPTRDPFLAFFQIFTTNDADYAHIETIVWSEIKKASEKLLSANILSLLKEELYTSELFSRDGSMHIALQLAEYVAAGDWREYAASLKTIARITSDDVQRALRTYLTASQVTIGTLEKKQ